MNFQTFFFATITLIILIWTIFLVYKLIMFILEKKKYTREYFVFIGLNALVYVSVLSLSYIYANQTWTQVINFSIKLICDTLNMDASPYLVNLTKPTFSESIIAILVPILVYYFVINIFRQWNGEISQRQAEEDKRRDSPDILKDLLAYLKKDEKLRIHKPYEDAIDFTFTQIEEKKLQWHIQFAELLTIKSKQYKIDIDADWYVEERTFISKHGSLDQAIAIFCCIDEPTKKDILKFLEFVNSFKPHLIFTKYIIGVENPIKEKREETINGITLLYRYKDEFLNTLVDFSSYRNYIKKKFEKEEIIQGYSISLSQTYTSPSGKVRLRNLEKDKAIFSDTIKSIDNYIIDWINDSSDAKHLAILGEYGQGKSVLAQQICYLLCEGKVISNRIPILIELRGKFPKQYGEKISLFSDWATSFGIDARALIKLHLAGKLLLIFDGFDEMELVGDYNIRLFHFKKLWEFATPNSKFIITGRPNFFLNDNELRILLRTGEDYKNSHYFCEEIHINPFTIEQIKYALRFTEDNIKNDILQTIDKQGRTSSFFDLISRPTHLFMASLVWKERLSKFKSNINSALVYKEFLEHSYSRQDKKIVETPLTIYERAYFMQGIASKLVSDSDFTNQISQKELNEIVIKLYESFPNEITKAQAVLTTNTRPLNKRFDEIYDKETVFLDIRSCGILVRDWSTFDKFKFAHKSFMEYLASDYYLTHLLKNGKTSISNEDVSIDIISKNSIKKALGIELNQFKKTPEMFNFIVQLLCNKIQIEKQLKDEEKAKIIYKIIYPYKWMPFALSFYLRSILLITSGYMIYGIIALCLITLNLLSIANISENIVNLVSSFFIVFIIFIIFSDNNFLTIKTLHHSKNSYIKDSDNLFLWFSTCLELNIPPETLQKLMTKKLYDNIETQLDHFMNSKQDWIKALDNNLMILYTEKLSSLTFTLYKKNKNDNSR